MDKLFDSYWLIRLTALLLALSLFLYVKAENSANSDSSTSQETDIIKNVELEVYYDAENLIVTGLPKTVDVTIKGPVQLVKQAKLLKDFKVFVDLNSLLIGEHRVTIQQENFSPKLEVSIDPGMVDIVIEEKVTQEFRVEPEMNSRLIAEDYILKSKIAEPTHVYVTGAKSVIDSISYVKATVKSDSGINKSFEQQANVKVLDRDLNKLDVTIQPDVVKVKVEINEYSRDLPLTIKQTGTLQDGVTIDKMTVEPAKLTVYGPKAILDAKNEIIVEFDVSQLVESGSYEAKVKVPDGASKLSAETVTIHADVTKVVTEATADMAPEQDTGQADSVE
ncbi:CdaR family protein [Solibacillus sp. CAU 1738]|uniref:CdaR family protein n=1 Tax=Solibacillus sp. CAU 1738 TaxID=3140363 RepID=UPI003261925E